MTDPLPRATGSMRAESSSASDSVSSDTASPAVPGVFAAGERWRRYQISGPRPDAAPGVYDAVNVGSMDSVIVRVEPVTPATEWRRQTWNRILELPIPAERIVALFEAHEEHGFRYEVTAAPPATSFREWISCHQAGPKAVETAMRQLAAVLDALHAKEVVHFNLSPNTLFMADSEEGMELVVGGWDYATVVTQPGLIPAPVNPFYAPPEASGLTLHPPGPGLFAWDWWSLGRVIQEFVLGRHVLGYFLDQDVSRPTPDQWQKAEALLAEKEPAGVKAGALEIMPPIPQVIGALLRGLLAGCRDGRWRGDEIQRWLAREAVKDRYELSRNERLFWWKGRAYTIPEAAAYFSSTERWDEGEANVFPVGSGAGSLLAFLADIPAHQETFRKLKGTLEMLALPTWQHIPIEARKTAVAAVIWLMLAEGGTKTVFSVRGRPMDWPGLQRLLQECPPAQGAALLRALTAPPLLQLLESLDATAARTLSLVASTGIEALNQAEQHGWVMPGDAVAQVNVLTLSLEGVKELNERLKPLRTQFATNKHPVLAESMAKSSPERWRLVLLAYTGSRASHYGYITHAERNRARYRELKERGEMLITALFWKRLGDALTLGALVFAPWWVWGLIWGAINAHSIVVNHAWVPSLVATVLTLGLRFDVARRLRIRTLLYAPESPPWNWNDGALRCRREFQALRERLNIASIPEMMVELRSIEKEVADLPLNPRPEPLRSEPKFVEAWVSGTLSILVALLLAFQSFLPSNLAGRAYQVVVAQATSWTAEPAPPAPARERTLDDDPLKGLTLPPGAEPGTYEAADDGFGPYLRGPLARWDLPETATAPAPPVQEQRPATPEQSVQAMVAGELLLRPYVRTTVRGVVAIRLPEAILPSFMLFDGEARQLASRDVYVLKEKPAEKAWFALGDQRVIYLGDPPPPEPVPAYQVHTEDPRDRGK